MSGNAVKNSISRVTSKRPFIWFLLGLAAATAIAAGVSSAIFFENGIYPDPGFPLQAASVGIFLLTTVMLAVQTGFQLRAERAALSKSSPSPLTIYTSLETQTSCLPRRTEFIK